MRPYGKPHSGYHLKCPSFGAQFNTRPGHSASDACPHAEGGVVRPGVGELPPPARPAGPACRHLRGCPPCRRPREPAVSAWELKARESKASLWPGEWPILVSKESMESVWPMVSVQPKESARLRGKRRGFSLHEVFWRRVIGVSGPHVVQFPPSGGSAATT